MAFVAAIAFSSALNGTRPTNPEVTSRLSTTPFFSGRNPWESTDAEIYAP